MRSEDFTDDASGQAGTWLRVDLHKIWIHIQLDFKVSARWLPPCFNGAKCFSTVLWVKTLAEFHCLLKKPKVDQSETFGRPSPSFMLWLHLVYSSWNFYSSWQDRSDMTGIIQRCENQSRSWFHYYKGGRGVFVGNGCHRLGACPLHCHCLKPKGWPSRQYKVIDLQCTFRPHTHF